MTSQPIPWLNYRVCDTEAEAEAFADTLIDGGVIQYQDDGKWHVFGLLDTATVGLPC